MKVVFLGNNNFSVSVLKSLLSSNHQVLCAFGNLDKQSGRGGKVVFSPLKSFCLQNGIEYYGCQNISKDGFEALSKYAPDALITASFGQILRKNVLEFAPYGVINVHTSLLPKYRGSCPSNWVVINGEKTTGITIMKTAQKVDSGEIYAQMQLPVLEDETAGELLDRLSTISGDFLIKTLNQIESGTLTGKAQDEEQATYFPMLSKDMAKIDFGKTAKEIQNFCNGLNPWPIAFVESADTYLKVYKAMPIENKWGVDLSSFSNGQVVLSSPKTGLIVKCEGGLVLLDSIQAPNGKIMPSTAYLNGKSVAVGEQF